MSHEHGNGAGRAAVKRVGAMPDSRVKREPTRETARSCRTLRAEKAACMEARFSWCF